METQDKTEDFLRETIRMVDLLVNKITASPHRYLTERVIVDTKTRIDKLSSEMSRDPIAVSKILIELGYALGYIQCLRDKERS